MQWDGGVNGGFSKAKPWLPVPSTYKTHNVEAESKDPNSVLDFYKRVLKLRHTNTALLDGGYRAINQNDPNVLTYLREYKDQAAVVVLNMTGAPQKIDLELNGGKIGERLLSDGDSSARGSQVALAPYGVFIGQVTK
jgi:alpha-glucosidase